MMSLSRKLGLAALLAFTSGTVACAAPTDEVDDLDEVGVDEGEVRITMSRNPGALIDTPFYFSVPKDSLSGPLNRRGYSYPTLWNPASEGSLEDVGLRVIAVPEGGPHGSAARKNALRQMSRELASAGVLQDGDVVLSFRPELAESMAYPHIQMGSTHAGLAFTRNGQGFNVDQPLNAEYNTVRSGQFVGQFDSKHYEEVNALHIVRPRNLTEGDKANLRTWIDNLGKTHQEIRAAGGLAFNSDYLRPLLTNPRYQGSVQYVATRLGKVLLRLERPSADLSMFCSELSFYLLALSKCTEDQIREAGELAACAAEEAAPFAPMKFADADGAGLADGPLMSLMAGNPSAEATPGFIHSIFADGRNSGGLSSGHRAVAAAVEPLLPVVKAYYEARLASPEMGAQLATQVNTLTQNVRNYSPTAFLVNATLPTDHPARKMDYVATIVMTPAGNDGIVKARRLAQNPVP
jgi:hypothetical protein